MVLRAPPGQVLGIEKEVDMRAWGGPPGCMWDEMWEILCREKPGVTPRELRRKWEGKMKVRDLFGTKSRFPEFTEADFLPALPSQLAWDGYFRH